LRSIAPPADRHEASPTDCSPTVAIFRKRATGRQRLPKGASGRACATLAWLVWWKDRPLHVTSPQPTWVLV